MSRSRHLRIAAIHENRDTILRRRRRSLGGFHDARPMSGEILAGERGRCRLRKACREQRNCIHFLAAIGIPCASRNQSIIARFHTTRSRLLCCDLILGWLIHWLFLLAWIRTTLQSLGQMDSVENHHFRRLAGFARSVIEFVIVRVAHRQSYPIRQSGRR